ncbi:MAG: VWA domain-containing protein [Crocosphaera sp.]|uniref:vWA domain-containing protein n=1 Tax=Crocosphaera sp. TaxID=2729996 RepID=UPI0025901673|nr:vWA domain-containing protein [Crocosphaera sp.]MCH2245665.1 VWA domain-containing protein [Crocosphaera sp.]
MFDLTITPDRPYKYTNQPSEHILRVRLTPQQTNQAGLPLHLAIALDTSGSMQGEKLEQAKLACQQILAQLRPQDHLSLASYATHINEIARYSQANDNMTQSAIKSLSSSGVTRMDIALHWLEEVLNQSTVENQTRIAILITDGHATTPQGKITDETKPLIEQADKLSQDQIVLHTVGLGNAENFNTGFLLELSKEGNGTFLYADHPEDLSSELESRLHDSQSIILKTAQLQLMPLNGSKIEGFCQLRPEYQPLEEIIPNQISLNTVYGDQLTDVLIHLQVPPLQKDSHNNTQSVLDVILVGEDQIISQCQAAINLTQSYKESQTMNEEVRRDRYLWEVNLDTQEIFRTNDPNNTGVLLQQIEANALKSGQKDIAQKAAEEYQDLVKTGKLNMHRTTGVLNKARKAGKNHE